MIGSPPHIKREEEKRAHEMMQSLTVWDPPEFNMMFFMWVAVFSRHAYCTDLPISPQLLLAHSTRSIPVDRLLASYHRSYLQRLNHCPNHLHRQGV